MSVPAPPPYQVGPATGRLVPSTDSPPTKPRLKRVATPHEQTKKLAKSRGHPKPFSHVVERLIDWFTMAPCAVFKTLLNVGDCFLKIMVSPPLVQGRRAL